MAKHSINQYIDSKISNALKSDMLNLREQIHQDPELSNQEFKTQQKLLAEFKKCNCRELHEVGTGIIARIKGQDHTRIPIAIRVDIDALPIQENTGLSFSSKNKNIMHACGHDVHATWGVGVARLLSETPALSDVIIICQPAEEIATGATQILKSAKLPKEIAAIFGGHVDRRYHIGEVASQVGPMSSYSDSFNIKVIGQSAHAARPNEGLNPLPELFKLGEEILQINEQFGNDTNFITMTQTNSGTRDNIIPDAAMIGGTIRCLDPMVRKALRESLLKLSRKSRDLNVQVKLDARSPAVINASKLKGIAQQSIQLALDNSSAIKLKQPNMASEDFGFFSQQYPTWYFRFGARHQDQPFIPVHTPHFYAENDTVFIGMLVFFSCVTLASEKYST